MKTNNLTGTLACAALAFVSLLAPAVAFADATPTEQSDDQTQTLKGTQSGFYREFDSFYNSSNPMPVMEISRRMSQKVDEESSRLGAGAQLGQGQDFGHGFQEGQQPPVPALF